MRTLGLAAAVVVWAVSASAQPLTLEFRDGRVSLDATAVPVRTVLAEWARLGGTKVVGGDRVTGTPLTLRLENVPEAQALEIILRQVAGYMAAPRRAGSVGASAYDRILVLPTSTTAAAAAAPTTRAGGSGAAGTQRNRPAFVAPAPPVEEPPPPQVDESDTGVNEPPFQFPQQNPFQAVGQPGAFGTPMPAGQNPFAQLGQGTPASGVTVNPAPPQGVPVLQFPGMPPQPGGTPGTFGVVGAPTPGVVVQPPTPAQPGVRPPG